ncbi:MAG: flagellar motor protein MotA, partial [Pseudomonadota bacterium]
GGDIADMFGSLKEGLRAPLSGMGTAFSSSLFGLAGSLVLGFLDLQLGQAQNRFYNELEDWLSGFAKITEAAGDGAGVGGVGASSYLTAILEQSADSLDNIDRHLKRSAEREGEMQLTLEGLSQSINTLVQGIGESQAEARAALAGQERMVDSLRDLTRGIERSQSDRGSDALAGSIGAVDQKMAQLVALQKEAQSGVSEELSHEFRRLARTIAAIIDERAANDTAETDE